MYINKIFNWENCTFFFTKYNTNLEAFLTVYMGKNIFK